MKLEQLFLKEEELPILGETHKIFFQIPIHPKLLDPTLKIDKSIARKICSSRGLEISFMDNGFVKSFSMDNGVNGALYFDNQKLNYKSYALVFLNFSEEKFREFELRKGETNIFIYSHKDIDTVCKALFFRGLAIEYMNEVYRQVFK